MEQLQSDNPLEVDITRIIEAPTTTRTTEEDMTSSYIVAAFLRETEAVYRHHRAFAQTSTCLYDCLRPETHMLLKTLGKKLGE
jgi:hypothetical protein